EFRRFVLLSGPPGTELQWLQSVDDSGLAFIVMDPRQVVAGYRVELSPHELAELAVNDVGELDVYTLVVVPRDRRQMRTNLKAPILINSRQRLAKQAVLDKSEYPIRYYLSAAADSEVSHARSHP
ncbi:MAG: flagellar assembly protein FliW, partial [Candidatus Hydrogenedentales bacterium]